MKPESKGRRAIDAHDRLWPFVLLSFHGVVQSKFDTAVHARKIRPLSVRSSRVFLRSVLRAAPPGACESSPVRWADEDGATKALSSLEHRMRTFQRFVAITVLGCASCAHQQAEIASLESRIAALEAQRHEAPCAGAPSPAASAESPRQALENAVPVELGDAEFYDGDTIAITEIRGTETLLRPGGTFLVKGRYHLASHDNATLLFSVTATHGTGRAPIPVDSRLAVSRGDGEFALVTTINGAGYPHLTFYGSDGHPFGGVYFGNGESVLPKKTWSYRDP
jgi:hypothetical protein